MKESAGKHSGKSKAVPLEMTTPWQKYANLVLIPLIIGLSVFLLVRFRLNAAAQAKANEMGLLSDVQMRLAEFRTMDIPRGASMEQLASFRDSKYLEVEKLIDQLLESAKEPTIRSEALVARGDLNWIIANFPALPGATTQPTLATPKPAEAYLEEAQSSYDQVLKDYANQPISRASARLGLGAIAENRGYFDAAIKDYQTLVDDTATPAAFTLVAQLHLTTIKSAREPYFFGSFGGPAMTPDLLPTTQSTTAPSMQPTTQSKTVPTTVPVMSKAPTTQPGH